MKHHINTDHSAIQHTTKIARHMKIRPRSKPKATIARKRDDRNAGTILEYQWLAYTSLGYVMARDLKRVWGKRKREKQKRQNPPLKGNTTAVPI